MPSTIVRIGAEQSRRLYVRRPWIPRRASTGGAAVAPPSKHRLRSATIPAAAKLDSQPGIRASEWPGCRARYAVPSRISTRTGSPPPDPATRSKISSNMRWVFWNLSLLKVEPQLKLQGSCKTRLAGDFSELAGGRSKLRVAQVRVIDEIISLGAKLDSSPVVDGESLDQGEIPIL